MAISEYDKLQLEQRELERKLDAISIRNVHSKYSGMRKSYAMHTPAEVMRNLGKREEHQKVKTIGVKANIK